MNNGAPDLTLVRDAVTASVAWLGGDGSIEDLERMVLKAGGEEHGEGAQAWFGVRGTKRKGVTHKRADVGAELADVVLAALVALAGIDANAGAALLPAAIDSALDIASGTDRDVTRALLRVQVAAGQAAEAVLDMTVVAVADRLPRLVVAAVNAIAWLGFDPAEVLTAKARTVAARIAAHQEAAR